MGAQVSARCLGLCLTILGVSACQLLEPKPAASPPAPEPSAATPSDEPAPLPPEETPPPPSTAEPAPAKPPEAGITTTGTPTRGTLPKAVVDEKLASAGPAIRACYEQGLKQKPELRGTVSINLVVAPDGKVAHTDVTRTDDDLDDDATVNCILAQIQKLEFPQPRGGRVFVNYPVVLGPSRAAP
jgi:outer membrane biosynthesis protein TonB